MKLLLDEQMPKSIAKAFPAEIHIHTVQSQGWAGATNGALPKLAHESGFTALVSADKNIASQHNEKLLPVAVVILSVVRLRADNLIPLIPKPETTVESTYQRSLAYK